MSQAIEERSRVIREVEAELAAMTKDVAAQIQPFLIDPYQTDRPWSYGPEIHRCWTVIEDKFSNTGIAYCEAGITYKESRWLLVWIDGDLDIGMDSSWFETLEDAFLDSRMAISQGLEDRYERKS